MDREPRPTFFDIDKDYPALDEITQAPFLPSGRNLTGSAAGRPDAAAISRSRFRRARDFQHHAEALERVHAGMRRLQDRAQLPRCPETCKRARSGSQLIQAFFSILDPGKSVPKHEGPYLGYLRYHLGLRVPKDNPPKIIVNGQDYVWKEGEAVLFDDSWPHEVINHSNETRAVLIVDVRRPLPITADLVNGFVTNVIARRFYGRPVARKAEKFARGDYSESLGVH